VCNIYRIAEAWIFAPDLLQSSRNFFNPMSVKGCFITDSSMPNGIVQTCAPAFAASTTRSVILLYGSEISRPSRDG
jgi:hypothetical protein